MGAGHPEDQAVVVCVCAKLCYVHLSVILWAVAQQVRLSKGFSRQEYWSGLPCPPPGNLPNSGIEPPLAGLLHWQAGSLLLVPSEKPYIIYIHLIFNTI